MKAFEIDIPDPLYYKAVSYADKTGITFSELRSRAVIELMDCSDAELKLRAKDLVEEDTND